MSTCYVSEIRIFAFAFAPKGWAFCNGQILSIAQNQALFALLGTTYGGDGQTTFQLPNLKSRTPLSFGQSISGSNYNLGQIGGAETVTLTSNMLPQHTHNFIASTAPADPTNGINPPNSLLANTNVLGSQNYISFSTPKPLNAGSITSSPVGQGHTNIQPFLTLNFCIALQGIFPSHN